MPYLPLDEPDRRSIHDGALGVLEEVGLKAPRRLLERLRDAGLETDPASERLRLDRVSVEAALRRAPRSLRLGARGEGHGLLLDGRRTHVAPDGCGARTVDLDTGAVRPARLDDVAWSARLTDALPEFHLYWTMVSAQDVPRELRVASECLAALRNTVKHVQMIDVARPEEAEALCRMARVLNQEGLVEGPPLSALISVVSPLRIDPDGTDAALVLAGAGLPVVCCSMPIASVTAPATPAGCLLLAHAECLAQIAILQTLHPGAPVIYCSFACFADPRSGATSYEDPRGAWTAAAAAQLGRSLGIPCFSSAGPLAMLVGPDLTSGGGLLETSTLLAYEQLVIDGEAMRDARLAAAIPGVDPETLAEGVIREVGPAGHFMSRKHTLRHIREFVVPRFAGAGREAARREAARLLSSHQAPPLPPAVDAALSGIAEAPTRAAAR